MPTLGGRTHPSSDVSVSSRRGRQPRDDATYDGRVQRTRLRIDQEN